MRPERPFQQRAASSERQRPSRIWRPLYSRAVPKPDDWYVSVDDLVSHERATLVVAPWPRVDKQGRLLFGAPNAQLRQSADPAGLQRLADRSRSGKRPIRVGDAFLARGSTPDHESWNRLIDVTAGAREAAKIALYAAVAARLDPRAGRSLSARATEPPEPPRTGPVAGPAI
jgi:hypothetical protein